MKITAIITSRDPQNKSKLQTDIDELINSVFSPMVEDERVILAPNSFILSRANLVILADADKDKSPSALPNSFFFPTYPAQTRYIGIKKDPAHQLRCHKVLFGSRLTLYPVRLSLFALSRINLFAF